MTIRTRDIAMLERALKGNVHPELMKVIFSLVEEVAALKHNMRTMAGLMDRLVENQIIQADATSNITKSVAMKRLKQMGMEVGSDPSITGEVEEDGR